MFVYFLFYYVGQCVIVPFVAKMIMTPTYLDIFFCEISHFIFHFFII